MPLPKGGLDPWPPREFQAQAEEVALAAAWYEGDTATLTKVYGGQPSARPSERQQRGMLNQLREFFWGRQVNEAQSVRMHLPVAADIADAAAALLFGEEPTLTIGEAHGEREVRADGTIADPSTDQAEAMATEDRLAELVELDGISSTLLEAAEFASALGAVYLRPSWDREVSDHPMLTIVNADHAVPEWRFGRLMGVTFWSVVYRDHANAVWRHLERYERGAILHGLYVGTETTLGHQVPLTEHKTTAAVIGPDAANDEGEIFLPDGLKDQIAVRCIVNATSRKRIPDGRSDTCGLESEMNALDETWSSWMRDIRLGKARIIVPDEYLDTQSGRGGGKTFDLDREIFSPIEMGPTARDNAGIQLIQPAIRTDDHYRTCTELYRVITRSAGYNPRSFGEDSDGGQKTATEVRDRGALDLRTTGKKQRRFGRGLGDIGYQLLVIDNELFKSGVKPMRPQCTFVDPTEADIRERASTLNLINLAQAASIIERVRQLHPEWDEPQVAQEASLIREEQGVNADPTGGFGA